VYGNTGSEMNSLELDYGKPQHMY